MAMTRPQGNPPADAAHAASRWDVQAMIAGGSVALAVGLIATGLATFLDDDSPVRALLVVITLLGFSFGAALAAWVQRRGLPLSHGIATALVTYVLVDGVFVVVKLIRGRDVNWLGLILKFTLVGALGVAGGLLGAVLRRRGLVPSAESRSRAR